MIDVSTQIERYLASKKNAWAPSTLKSEGARLRAIQEQIALGPDFLYKYLYDKAPYTIKTTFIRVSNFMDFCAPALKGNPFKDWMQTNARMFKNAYTPKTPSIDYRAAKEAIATLSCEATKAKAYQLLQGGLRWNESFTVANGQCFGKGEKYRTTFVPSVSYAYSYSHFRNQLKKIGLKPHDLRKIRATHLASKGMREADLCKVFGWNSFETAKFYMAPLQDDELKEIMNGD